jgi:hypothetical protein
MSIQTIDVACIWKNLLWFLTWLWCLYGCHHGLFFFLFACFHIVIRYPIVCAMFVNLPCIIMCFHCCCMFNVLWYRKCTPCFYSSHVFSHNIVASLCCCNVDRFILAIAILRYKYKLALNTIVIKLFVVGTCKPWANFWIRS